MRPAVDLLINERTVYVEFPSSMQDETYGRTSQLFWPSWAEWAWIPLSGNGAIPGELAGQTVIV